MPLRDFSGLRLVRGDGSLNGSILNSEGVAMRGLIVCGILMLGAWTVAGQEKTAPMPVPKSPLAEARQRLQKGNYAEARATYEKRLSDATFGPAAAIGILQSHREEGELVRAREAIDAAIKQFPQSPDLLAARGDLLYSLGQYDAAL
ncbi:MAG: tetratricopeptide repeat protein, partial [Gemmataceae bacterium]